MTNRPKDVKNGVMVKIILSSYSPFVDGVMQGLPDGRVETESTGKFSMMKELPLSQIPKKGDVICFCLGGKTVKAGVSHLEITRDKVIAVVEKEIIFGERNSPFVQG